MKAQKPGPEGLFPGDMRISELIYDSPKAFLSVLGFIYGMRAELMNVIMEVPDDIDMQMLIPECDHAEQSLNGHLMGRALNIEKILLMIRQPEGTGSYTIRVKDEMLPENTGKGSSTVPNSFLSFTPMSDLLTGSVLKSPGPGVLCKWIHLQIPYRLLLPR